MKSCKYHVCKNEFEVSGTNTTFCSFKCKNSYFVDFQRKRMKVRAVLYKGGKCEKCGYNSCIWALEFHHRNKLEKSFSLGNPETRAWLKLKNEIDKCDLLCANCHREKEFEEKCNEGKSQVYLDALEYETKLLESERSEHDI